MKTKQVFNLMNIVSWIVFIGYCIKVGSITIVSIISIFGNKRATENLYMGIDLYNLYNYSVGYFSFSVCLFILIVSLQAYVFYLLIKMFKAMDINKPFNTTIMNLIFRISYVVLAVGLLGIITNSYMTWLSDKVSFTQLELGTSGYIFMAGVVFIVASLFKRAIEIQQENELTI